jgi:hypothetical protein
MTLMEAQFRGMSSIARILNRSIITDIRWSVCFTQWLGTTIHSLSILRLMKSSGPYGNLGQCETNNAGFHLTGPERGNNFNVYRGSSIPGYDFNHARVEPSGPPASQPPNHGGYTMVSASHTLSKGHHLIYNSMKPNVQYGSAGQAEVNYAGRQPAIDQLSRRTMNFSPLPGPAGEYTVPNNQEAAPLWCLGNCWISYVSEDELHLTIAFKKNPFA